MKTLYWNMYLKIFSQNLHKILEDKLQFSNLILLWRWKYFLNKNDPATVGKPLRMLSDWKLSEKEEENDEISEPTDGAFFFSQIKFVQPIKRGCFSKRKGGKRGLSSKAKESYLHQGKLKKVIYTRESNRVSISPPARNFLPK